MSEKSKMPFELLLLLTFFLFICAAIATCYVIGPQAKPVSGIVIDRDHIPQGWDVSLASFGFDQNGVPVLIPMPSPEEWTITLDTDSGKVTIPVSKETWQSLSLGQQATLTK
ncbi:hypothetical protein KC887_00190 [Candidatus Kaiserbacteria bacterium]|nr:hypothetical protein [Candidatus Kaiserbacteria bacterium]